MTFVETGSVFNFTRFTNSLRRKMEKKKTLGKCNDARTRLPVVLDVTDPFRMVDRTCEPHACFPFPLHDYLAACAIRFNDFAFVWPYFRFARCGTGEL